MREREGRYMRKVFGWRRPEEGEMVDQNVVRD